MTPFKCPHCGTTSYEAIAKPGSSRKVFACCGCTAVFLDPERFTLKGQTQVPARPPGWIQPPS
ncbi:MAG: hypothetical protein KDI71_03675 [Xanthomonadales bacterium]|nr:hypothetical protein [Xanthomonadales bacterium]